MAEITLKDMLRSVGKELGKRRSVYPRYVADPNNKMTQEIADHEIACMDALYALLKGLIESGVVPEKIAAGIE